MGNKRKEDRAYTRRQALKLAGFSVAGAAVTMTLGSIEKSYAATGNNSQNQKETFENQFYTNLFTPLTIGTITVRNRIMSTAHFTGFAKGGMPSDKHRQYWGSKAKGGIGLIMTEIQPVHPTAGIMPSLIHNYRDEIIPAFKPVVDEVHAHGGRLIAQLWHPGKSTLPFAVSELVSASAIRSRKYGGRPRALMVREIKNLVESYAQSAVRLRQAGLDGIEIHCAHNYLPQQFMSPIHNKRSDEYGGSENNRLRFPLEICQAVRRAVGNDFTIGIRISGDEFNYGGYDLSDMKRMIPKLVKAGTLDYVNVSHSGKDVIAPMGTEHGAYVYLAEEIKKKVDVPVFCIGRITTPDMAESIISKGRADMVGMTRANMSDPNLANKAKSGRADEIRTCIGMMLCWSRTRHPEGITCALNPSVGNEEDLAINSAKDPKKVMVIGGGAAGMEAARVAAVRGHTVTIYEKEKGLGGQLVMAAKTPTRLEMAKPMVYYTSTFKRLGVKVILGTQVSQALIQNENPDVVIVATGGLPKNLSFKPEGRIDVVQGRHVLLGLAKTGKNVVVIASSTGGMEPLTTAEFLAAQGKNVKVALPYHSVKKGVERTTGRMLFERLQNKQVELMTNCTVTAIDSYGVQLTGGDKLFLRDVDTVVLAMGSEPNNTLFKQISRSNREIHAIGQCKTPGELVDAVKDGLETARKI